MKKFHHAFEVQAPLDSVANFHKDSSALILLTPLQYALKLTNLNQFMKEPVLNL